MNQSEIDTFIDNLITDKNLSGLTPEGREQIASELKDALIEQINRAVLNNLSDEKLDELNDLLDKGGMDDEKMHDFIMNSGVDVPKVTTETLLYFRNFYLGDEQ